MLKRLLDVVLAAVALAVTAPVVVLAVVGVRLASPGPVLYRARRVGRGGVPFTMYKLRTMHPRQATRDSAITADRDPRVFPFGAWLRRSKIDELPQLINVLRGDMSIVGPRPEDPRIVAEHYSPMHRETLTIRPGLASPGSIYNYTHGERRIGAGTSEADYLEWVLPLKVALDTVYVRRASLVYDLSLVGRTMWAIAGRMCGRREFPEPSEMREAKLLLAVPVQEAQHGRRTGVASRAS